LLTQRSTRTCSFTKQRLALAPNNPSAWNYLRGVLDHNHNPYSKLTSFVEPYAVAQPNTDLEEGVLDVENPPPSKGAELPCPGAIEFLADVHEQEGGRESVFVAIKVSLYTQFSRKKSTDSGGVIQLWKSLAEEHDTIRKKCSHFLFSYSLLSVCSYPHLFWHRYWEYRIKEALLTLKN
jgi:protein farnesyltransferase/geranylgeranyltransferase type-1 subunit alpha